MSSFSMKEGVVMASQQRSNPNWHSVEGRYEALRARRRGRGALLWFLLILSVATAIIAAALWDWQQYGFGASWPVIAATINGSTAEPNYRADGSRIREEHTIIASYIYSVDSEIHAGTLQFTATNSEERQFYLDAYPVNAQIGVWHHPVFHQVHFTQVQFPHGFGRIYNLIALGVGAVFALLAAFTLNNALAAFAQARQARRG